MAQIKSTNDFVAETKGHCFLCSNATNILQSTRGGFGSGLSKVPKPPPVYSLHYLSRYLRLDMRKVFTGAGNIPPSLLARVEKSRLKAELCEECADVAGRFSNLYRQLEKVELEVASCLVDIQRKLESAMKLDKAGNCDEIFKDDWMAKVEIVEALRKDTVQKCSRKVRTLLPSTNIQRLTPKQVVGEKRKLKSSNPIKSRRMSAVEPYHESNYGDQAGGSPASISVPNEDEREYLDEQKLEIIDSDKLLDNEEVQLDLIPTRNAMTSEADHDQYQLSQAIPPPTEVDDVEDGKKAKGKLKCRNCRKEFSAKNAYQQHYLSVHMGVKYKCSECDKTFAQRPHLVYHQRSVHLGKQFQCTYCIKTFSLPHNRNRHMKLCAMRN